MTSKDSLAEKRKFLPLLHELLWTVRRYWWVAFSGMLLFTLLTLVGKQLEGNRPDEFTLIMEDSEVMLRVAGVVFGVFAAFCMFRFLWSRRESVLYLSVGTARPKQFLLRYCFGFVSVVLGIAVPFLITYCTEFTEIGDDYFGLCAHYTTVFAVSLSLISLLAYTVSVLVAVLCGNFLSALLSTAGVLAAPYAFLWGTQTMLGFYLFGTPLSKSLLTDHLGAGLFTMYTEQLGFERFSKLLLDRYAVIADSGGITLAERYKAEMATLPVARTTLLVVLMLLLAVIAGFAYCRRPFENAGKATVHPVLSHAAAVANALCVAALVLNMKAPAEGFLGAVILSALFILTLILATALIRLILTRDPRGVVKHYFIPCGVGAVALVLTILLGTGWFGYSSYVPDPMDVQSVTVTYNQNVTLLSDAGGSTFSRGHSPYFKGPSISGTGDGTNYYTFLYAHGFTKRDYALPELTLPEDIGTALAIHEAVISDGRKTFTGQPAEEFAETVVPAFFRVVYTLKNGETVERYYPCLSLAVLERTVEVENTLAFREEIAASHENIGFAEANTFEFGDPFFADFTAVTLSEEDCKTLIAALDLDHALLTAEDRYFSKNESDKVIGIIRNCRLSADSTLSRIGSHPHDRKYETNYITAAWENTLAFVREKGLDAYFAADYTISDVRYQRYTPRMFPDKMGMGVSYVFHSCENTVQIELLDYFDADDMVDSVTRATDPVPAEDWDAWLEASRPVALMTRPGRMVQIILTNSKGETRLVTRYIYEAEIPR